MMSRYHVWLNDIELTAINPDLYVADIAYQAAVPVVTLLGHGGADGQYSADAGRIENNKVTVNFSARFYSTADRQHVIQDINNWAARGGWLKTSDRPGQRLFVRCTRYASVLSAMRWTEVLSVEFAAYDWPYWQDETGNTLTVEQGKSGYLYLAGVRPAGIEATVTATEAISTCTLVCGDTTLTLSGISLPAGGTLKVDYTDDHHIQRIACNGISALDSRTAASDDELTGQPGRNLVRFTADGAGTCEFCAKGVYV